jgi:hypothetical protein
MKLRNFAIALVSVPVLSHAAWTIQTVDNTANTGFGASLALDPSTQAPAISYYRWYGPDFAGSSYTYFASLQNGAWSLEPVDQAIQTNGVTTSLAFKSTGTPAVTYTYFSTNIRYKERVSGSWGSSKDVDASDGGPLSGLVFQGATPSVVYYDNMGGDLEYGVLSGANFMRSTLDANSAGSSFSLAGTDSYLGVMYVRGGKLAYQVNQSGTWAPYQDALVDPLKNINARFVALAIAPGTQPGAPAAAAHVIYYYDGAPANGKYFYLTNDTENGLWSTPETIAQSGLVTLDLSAKFGLSIAVGSDNIVRVAFYDYVTHTLQYSERSGTGWSTPETVDTNPGGITCSLKLDSNNHPHIAYAALVFDMSASNYIAAGLKYARIATDDNSTNTDNGKTGSDKSSLTIKGKAKRTTTASKLKIQGTASNAVSVQWKLGSRPLKTTPVKAGKWTATISPLAKGKNKVKFLALSNTGTQSDVKTIVITRK